MQVEAAAPNYRQQLQDARAALQTNMVVSAETYAQLKRVRCITQMHRLDVPQHSMGDCPLAWLLVACDMLRSAWAHLWERFSSGVSVLGPATHV
jgi:hypothetical protein